MKPRLPYEGVLQDKKVSQRGRVVSVPIPQRQGGRVGSLSILQRQEARQVRKYRFRSSSVNYSLYISLPATIQQRAIAPYTVLSDAADRRLRFLIHHYCTVVAEENVTSIGPRYGWFLFSLQNRSFFHTIMASTASHAAYLRRGDLPYDFFYHKGEAIRLVNKQLEAGLCDEGIINTVALFSQQEAFRGAVSSTKLHMYGLLHLVHSVGGLDSPMLSSKTRRLITQTDQAACIVLNSKPLFSPNINITSSLELYFGPPSAITAHYTNLFRNPLLSFTSSIVDPEQAIVIEELCNKAGDVFWGLRNLTISLQAIHDGKEVVGRTEEDIQFSDRIEALERIVHELWYQQEHIIFRIFGWACVVYIYTILRGHPYQLAINTISARRIKLKLKLLEKSADLNILLGTFEDLFLWVLFRCGEAVSSRDKVWFAEQSVRILIVRRIETEEDVISAANTFLWPEKEVESGSIDSGYGSYMSTEKGVSFRDATSLPIQENEKDPGTEYLAALLANGDLSAVEKIVQDHFLWISLGDFAWIRDLQEAGYKTTEIAKCLKESVETSLWLSNVLALPGEGVRSKERSRTSSSDEVHGLSSDFHQTNCVHLENMARRSTRCLEKDDQINNLPSSLLDAAESTKKSVVSFCGLAGVFPPDDCPPGRYAVVADSTIHISYSSSDLYSVFRTIHAVTSDIGHSLRALQDGGFCCDRITIIAKSSTSRQVVMRPVYFKEFFIYLSLLQHAEHEAQCSERLLLENYTLLSDCAEAAFILMRSLLPEHFSTHDWINFDTSSSDVSDVLHRCALLTQLLSIGVVSYAQGHTGELWPQLLRHPPNKVLLHGCRQMDPPYFEVSYCGLGCMSELVGDDVIVIGLHPFPSAESTESGSRLSDTQDDEPLRQAFVGSVEDIVDSWGPAVLVSAPGAPYGEQIHSVLIGGGTIAIDSSRSRSSPDQGPIYHWGRLHTSNQGSRGFSIHDQLIIETITVQPSCPLDSQNCWRNSESYLKPLGTEADYWKLAERQAMFTAGQYVGIQVGEAYNRKTGTTLKTRILQRWNTMPDLRVLCQPWGLQISLCTGLARRVPIRHLIEEPMFAYIDGLALEGWDSIKKDIRLAFHDVIDYTQWSMQLTKEQRHCLITVVTFLLELLQDTGLDRESKELRLLWPHESSLSYTVCLRCDKTNLWARVLKDSPNCATFAAVTSVCLETPSYPCKVNTAPTWAGKGPLLSTAVSRVCQAGPPKIMGPMPWALQNGQQCWIDKKGGDIWVYTTKSPNTETELRVKINRFPRGLSMLRDWQVLRERQELTFEAEEVVVFGAAT